MQDYLKSFLKSPLPKSAQRPLCAMVLIGTLAMGTAPLHAQETSLNAPEVLDLDDPFARGITVPLTKPVMVSACQSKWPDHWRR